MPFINGRFYMNRAYGRAIERARTANQIWSEEIPGPTGVSLREQSFGNDVSLSETHRKDSDAHWVTIDGHHVLIESTQAGPARANNRTIRAHSSPGTKPARIIFNETFGLRPANKNPEDLHDARVAMAHTLLNAKGMRHPPQTVTDKLTATSARAILLDAQAKAAWADSQDALREAADSTDDTKGAVHFFLDYAGATSPSWATDDRETAQYGPFVNTAGGGDVPRGKVVTIRIYTEHPVY
jgi:hypothetical protein